MSEFSVNPAALAAVIDRMTAFDSALEAHLAHAAGSVARLGSSWYGDAGEAERSAQAQWDEGAREMREADGYCVTAGFLEGMIGVDPPAA